MSASSQGRYIKRQRWEEWSSVALLALLILLFSLLEPKFASAQNLLNVLRQAAPLIIASLGQAVVIIVGGIDLSQGSAAALAGMLAMMAAQAADSALIGWATLLILGASFGAVNGLLVARWKVPAFIATVGMLTYGHGLAYYLGGGLPIEFPPDGYSWFGQGYLGPIPVPVVAAIVVCLAVIFFMNRTALGQSIYAVGGNPRASALSGLDTSKVRLAAYAVGGLLTAMAALVLTGRVNSAPPNLYPTLPFEAIAAAAIGGIAMSGGEGVLWKVVVGVGVVSVLSNGLNLSGVTTYVQMMLIGGVTILAVGLDQVKLGSVLSRLQGSRTQPRRENV